MPQSASLTQNMNITHLKAQVSDSTHGTQWGQLKNATHESTVRKSTDSTPSVTWTWGLLEQGGQQQQEQRMRSGTGKLHFASPSRRQRSPGQVPTTLTTTANRPNNA